MNVGHLKDRASNTLSTLVLACSVVTIGLLFVMEKAERTKEALSIKGDYSAYYIAE